MAEFLAPGVYIAEVPSAAKTIDGVSTSTAGFVAGGRHGVQARAFGEVRAPDWTDGNEHDPGTTTAQAFAWAFEPLGFRIALAIGKLAAEGGGVASGLAVGASDGDGVPSLHVGAGIAVSAEGRTIDPDRPTSARCRDGDD